MFTPPLALLFVTSVGSDSPNSAILASMPNNKAGGQLHCGK